MCIEYRGLLIFSLTKLRCCPIFHTRSGTTTTVYDQAHKGCSAEVVRLKSSRNVVGKNKHSFMENYYLTKRVYKSFSIRSSLVCEKIMDFKTFIRTLSTYLIIREINRIKIQLCTLLITVIFIILCNECTVHVYQVLFCSGHGVTRVFSSEY